MTTYLVIIFGALSIISIITIVGFILTQTMINRNKKNNINTKISSEQLQVLPVDDLSDTDIQSSIAVISNDLLAKTSHQKSKTSNSNVTNPVANKITLEY